MTTPHAKTVHGRTLPVLMGSGLLLAATSLFAIDPPVPVPSGLVVLSQQPAPGTTDPNLAANYPDKYAWTLFLTVNQQAAQQVPVGNNQTTNNAVWETWPDDPYTFPASGDIDPQNPPQWPTGAGKAESNAKGAGKGKTMGLKRLRKGFAAHAPKIKLPKAAGANADTGTDVPDAGGEEVHRNKATFDYIIQNNLWYQEGIAEFFKKVVASKSQLQFTQNSVNFPIESIEVKANWVPILENQKSQYHWNYNEDGQLLGLVAMHISSKALPNWFWCTFEWSGNAGRSDYIGSHDTFGMKGDAAHQESNTTELNKVYPAGEMTDELLALFKEQGFTGDWATQWQNYRLKGSQIDFTDSLGRPLVLGNSVTEAGFVPTASCITCHSRGAVTSAGQNAFPIFGEKANLPLVGIPQQGSIADQNPSVLTYNGAPDPAWYFTFSGNDYPGNGLGMGSALVNMQTDFVWAIPLQANPIKKPAGK